MTNLLTVEAKVFSNTLIFLLQKCEKLLQQCKSCSHFFNKKSQCICHIFLQDRNFKVQLANNFIKFEQLGPG